MVIDYDLQWLMINRACVDGTERVQSATDLCLAEDGNGGVFNQQGLETVKWCVSLFIDL